MPYASFDDREQTINSLIVNTLADLNLTGDLTDNKYLQGKADGIGSAVNSTYHAAYDNGYGDGFAVGRQQYMNRSPEAIITSLMPIIYESMNSTTKDFLYSEWRRNGKIQAIKEAREYFRLNNMPGMSHLLESKLFVEALFASWDKALLAINVDSFVRTQIDEWNLKTETFMRDEQPDPWATNQFDEPPF